MQTIRFSLVFIIGLLIGYGYYTLIVEKFLPSRHIEQTSQMTKSNATSPKDSLTMTMDEQNDRIDRFLQKTDRFLKCLDKDTLPICQKKEKAQNTTTNHHPNTISQNLKAHKSKTSQRHTPIFIEAIYVIMIILFAVAFSAFILPQSIAAKYYYLTLELPPMFGVAGTLYAMARLAFESQNASSLIDAVRVNISDAVTTTIVGILFYAAHLLMAKSIETRGQQ